MSPDRDSSDYTFIVTMIFVLGNSGPKENSKRLRGAFRQAYELPELRIIVQAIEIGIP